MAGTIEDGSAPEGLVEPLARPLADALRGAVLTQVAAERPRRRAAVVHAGYLGGSEHLFAPEPGDRLDHALRTDAMAALLARARASAPGSAGGRTVLAWLTRPGPLELEDDDAAWLAAARAAAAEAGEPLTFVVVSRHGWWDPRSGLRREWRRLRR